MRIALLTTCLADAMHPRVPEAVQTLLRRLGHDVVVPPGQTCCGQMHLNTGYARQAVPVVRHHVETFESASYDVAVVPSGSCVGSIRHQHGSALRRLGHEGLADRADAVAGRTFELSELLVDVLGLDDVGAWFPHRVTYHPTCHSLRMIRVGDKPTTLLRAVDDLELVELPGQDQCCGFGGTFALKNSGTSTAMLEDKVAAVSSTRSVVCTAGDSSCLMQIGGGLSRAGDPTRTVHLAEILASTRERPWSP
ncbi:(Fe-S)-binding protein [Aeromicrobium sp. 50.2.37]|uniref:(Fe-S)-binding protein n=1 Tax=Aeromicrobium sp. 50.2.37 TaxID=2969305 RepID=UPI00214F70A5|nr:(Fe-S)-binding protein [Aeromicrobium sp. 50.2.37]MCR4514130.1 (Fe-S)-binding protein [Aeromicrobium sp. 50.2.37]